MVLTIDSKEHIKLILHECHDMSISGHLPSDRTLKRAKVTAWWPDWKKDVEAYCETCTTCQKSNRATGKRYVLLQEIGEPENRWEMINMAFVTGLPPGGKENFNCVRVVVDTFSKKT